MKLVSLALLFLGWLLVYASTANHGRFALHPWLGVVADAYTGETISIPKRAPNSAGASAIAGLTGSLAA